MEGCFPLPAPMFVPRFCDKTITLTYLCSQTQDLCLCILAICRISFTQGLTPRNFYKPFLNKNAACWNQRFNVIRSQRGLVRRNRKTRGLFIGKGKKSNYIEFQWISNETFINSKVKLGKWLILLGPWMHFCVLSKDTIGNHHQPWLYVGHSFIFSRCLPVFRLHACNTQWQWHFPNICRQKTWGT